MQKEFRSASIVARLFAAVAVTATIPFVRAQNPDGNGLPKHVTVTRNAASAAQAITRLATSSSNPWDRLSPPALNNIEPTTSNGAVPQGHGMNYYGGPVMLGTVNLYHVYYGTWDATQKVILEDFARNVGGSRYLNMTRSYYGSGLNRVANSLRFAGSATDDYSQGSSNVSPLIAVLDAIENGALPADPNGIYMILTSPDVSVPGFLTSFCGYHDTAAVPTSSGGAAVKYAFIGNPGWNGSCSVQTLTSPNNDPGVDAAISTYAHELAETITDPGTNAWMDSNANEMADKCAWSFGDGVLTAPNGSAYNLTLGTGAQKRNYMVQQLWPNDGAGSCQMQWPASVSSGWVNIVSKNSGKCLTATGTATERGQELIQDTCVGNDAQKFSFAVVNGGYEITAKSTSQQLDVRGGPAATANGVLVQTWPFWGGANELFGFSAPDAQGYGDITAFNSAKVLDVKGISKLDNTDIQQWVYLNGPNQSWKLVPVTDPASEN